MIPPIVPMSNNRTALTEYRRTAAAVSSPTDQRYPAPAIAAGLATGAAVGGGLALLGVFAPIAAALGVGAALLLGSSIKYTDQWEKAVVLRFGRYRGLRGPGLFSLVPVVDRLGYHLDHRGRPPACAAAA